MPTWSELITELNAYSQGSQKEEDVAKAKKWLAEKPAESISRLQNVLDGRNIIFYASAFLQKQNIPSENISITFEEINGLMTMVHGMDCSKGLTLVLHTPGGVTAATESIVAYLHSKFDDIEVLVPTYAMSAGTMISLAANRIIMGRQSQLGPIDPQLPINGNMVSANAIVNQFDKAKEEILKNTENSYVWAPILSQLGPALLQQAHDSLDYSEIIVAKWLRKRMFAGQPDAERRANNIASFFNGRNEENHKNHGHRIDMAELIERGLVVDRLEDNPELQDAALTLYHVFTIVFEKTHATKLMVNQLGKQWVKNFVNPPARHSKS